MEQQYSDLLTEECKVLKPDKVLKYGTAGENRSEFLVNAYIRSGGYLELGVGDVRTDESCWFP